MTKSTLKEKMLAFYHSIIFQVIAALPFFALGFGVSALINYPISAKYQESGIIIAVDPSDGEDFKYDISVKISTDNIYVLSSDSEFTIGEIYDITFSSNHTPTPIDDEILVMAKKF